MTTLPRPESAAIIDFPRQPMAQDTQPATPQQDRWHKAVNRMADPVFLSLPPVARAALFMIEELCAKGPMVGNRSALCSMLSIEPKHAYMALDPLVENGFIVAVVKGKIWTVNLPSTHPQQACNHRPTGVQQASNRKNKSASDAGFGGRSLTERLESRGEPNGSQNQKENLPPLSPPSGQPGAAVASPTAPASASAPKREVDWSDQEAKAVDWVTGALPELADELIGYFRSKTPASSRPSQYLAERIGEVKAQAQPKKGPAPPRAALIDGWKAAIAKGAGAPYAAKVIENRISEAFSGRAGTIASGVAAGAGDGAEPGNGGEPGTFGVANIVL